MKTSWLAVLFLLMLVAVFSVQNAGEITVRFLAWQFSTSAALIILLAAFSGSLIGLVLGARSRRTPPAMPPPSTPLASTRQPLNQNHEHS